MTAAVLYGKEDVKIEKVPIPRVNDGEVLVKSAGRADLRHRFESLSTRLSCSHDCATSPLRTRIGWSDRGSWPKCPRIQERNARRSLEFRALQMCFYCSKHQENLCEDLLFNNGAYAEYIPHPAPHC